jgi:hypothetical protein
VTWVRLEDCYFTHRKVADLSKDAKLLDLAAIAYSARELRDGVLSRADVRIVAAEVDVDEALVVAGQLVSAERWGRVQGGGFVIHDYLQYNPSREQVLEQRARDAERKRRGSERRVAQVARAANGQFAPPSASESEQDSTQDSGPEAERNPEIFHHVPDPVPDPYPGSTGPSLTPGLTPRARAPNEAPPRRAPGSQDCPICRRTFIGPYSEHQCAKVNRPPQRLGAVLRHGTLSRDELRVAEAELERMAAARAPPPAELPPDLVARDRELRAAERAQIEEPP